MKHIIFCMIIMSSAVEASFVDNLMMQISEKLEGVISEELHLKIFKSVDEKVKMPVIPKVNRSAKDSDFYNEVKGKKANPWPKNKNELDMNFVKEIYFVTRGVDVKDEELVNWLNVLSQGGTRQGVYRAIISDNTYRDFENLSETIGDDFVQFAKYFLKTYLNEKPSEDILVRMNFFQLKRIITERSLDVVDSFKNYDDLLSWYSVFSSDIATKYPAIWKNKVRTKKSRRFHYGWSSGVHEEFIYSEFLIKINKVMNQFRL